MAVIRWLGGAPIVAQVDTVTAVTVAATNTLTATTSTGRVFTHTCTGTDETAEMVALAAAWNAIDNIPEFMEVEAEASGATTVFTMKEAHAGKPFSFTFGATGGTAQFNRVATVVNSGPSDAAIAINWEGGVLPNGGGNTIVFENSDIPCLWNLDLCTGDTLNVRRENSYTAQIGLPIYNTDGAIEYPEYRARYLVGEINSLIVGIGPGEGPSREYYECGNVTTVALVYATGQSEDANLAACVIKGTGASSTLEVRGGSVAVAPLTGEVATLTSYKHLGGTLTLGSGVTLTTGTGRGGVIFTECAATTYDCRDCILIVNGTATAGTLNAQNATVFWNGTGTITAGSMYNGGLIDAEAAVGAFTITDMAFYPGGGIVDKNNRGTYTNAFTQPGGGDVGDRIYRFGLGRTLKPT